MPIFSPEQLDEMRHRLELGGIVIPPPNARQVQDRQLTGLIDVWFESRQVGFINAAIGRFTFSGRDIVSGKPKAGSTVTFRIKYPGDPRRNQPGSAADIEIE